MLSEKVGFGLALKRRFKHARSRTSDTERVSKRYFLRLARCVLVNCDEAGHALALDVLAAYRMSGTFGRYHKDVYVFGRNYLFEVNVEAVRECERFAFGERGENVLAVYFRLLFVGREHHDHVGFLCSLCGGEHGKPRFFCARRALRAGIETYDDFDAAVFEIECVRVSLRTVAYDCDRLFLQIVEVAVLCIEDFSHNIFLLLEEEFT